MTVLGGSGTWLHDRIGGEPPRKVVACLLRLYCLSTDILWVGPSSSSVQFKRDCGISLEWHRYSIVSDFKRILTGLVYPTSYTSLFPPLVSFETFLGAEEIFWGTLQHD